MKRRAFHRSPLLAGMAPLILALGTAVASAEPLDRLLEGYRSEGADPFSAERGRALWTRQVRPDAGTRPRSCTTCHGEDPRGVGRHARTGKRIEPMAHSANPERFTNPRKVEKWFRRNCKWTFGRPCTTQEKGDILTYLSSQ